MERTEDVKCNWKMAQTPATVFEPGAGQVPCTPTPGRVGRFFPSPSSDSQSSNVKMGNLHTLRESTPSMRNSRKGSSQNKVDGEQLECNTPGSTRKKPKFKHAEGNQNIRNSSFISPNARKPKLLHRNEATISVSKAVVKGDVSAKMKARMQEMEWNSILGTFEVSDDKYLVLEVERISNFAFKANIKGMGSGIILLDPVSKYSPEKIAYNYIQLGKPLHELTYANWILEPSFSDT